MQKLLVILLVGLAASSVFGAVVRSRRSTSCPDGWTSFEKSCYTFVNRTLAATAEQTCSKFGGKLASVHSEKENKFIVDFGNNIRGTNFHYIIGFKGLSKSQPYTVSWSDGTTGQFTNEIENTKPQWVPSDCYKVSGEGVNRYTWYTFPCTSYGMAVCKRSTGVVTPPSRCEEGWTYFEKSNSCFKVLPKTIASAAPKACEDQGSKLASILSEEENIFVVAQANKYFGTNYHYIIGFKKLSTAKPYKTEWTDGTTGDFTNGLEHFQDKLNQNGCYKICGDGKSVFPWNEIDCSHQGLPICKKLAHKSG